MPQRAHRSQKVDSLDLEAEAILEKLVLVGARIQEQITEFSALLAVLKESRKKRKNRKDARELDENKEPTWRYAVKVKIPDDISLTKRMTEYATSKGLEDISDHWESFVNYYRKSGKKWADWSRVWFDWVRREAKSKAASTRYTPKTSASLREYY